MKFAPAAFAVAALLMQPAAVFAQTFTTPPATTGAPVTPGQFPAGPASGQHGPEGQGHGEHHPEIHRAMKRLEAAKEDLQHAAHDYDGHRAQAVQLIDQAEAQLQIALRDPR